MTTNITPDDIHRIRQALRTAERTKRLQAQRNPNYAEADKQRKDAEQIRTTRHKLHTITTTETDPTR